MIYIYMKYAIVKLEKDVIWIECITENQMVTFDEINNTITRSGSVTMLPFNQNFVWIHDITDLLANVDPDELILEYSNNSAHLAEVFSLDNTPQ